MDISIFITIPTAIKNRLAMIALNNAISRDDKFMFLTNMPMLPKTIIEIIIDILALIKIPPLYLIADN